MKSIPVSILCHTTGAIPLSSALKCHCMSPFAGTDSSISSTLISHEINGSEQVHLSSAQSRPSPCGCGGLEMPLQQEELLLCCSHWWHPQLQDKSGGSLPSLRSWFLQEQPEVLSSRRLHTDKGICSHVPLPARKLHPQAEPAWGSPRAVYWSESTAERDPKSELQFNRKMKINAVVQKQCQSEDTA